MTEEGWIDPRENGSTEWIEGAFLAANGTVEYE